MTARHEQAGREAGVARASRWPAWLDVIQGATGLALVVFMWAHLFAVSSILLGKDAMYQVARFFEGSFLFAEPQPVLVSLVALVVFILFAVHALVAIRKLPASYRQYRVYLRHLRGMRHEETTLWLVQVVTGLVLMFFATAHIYEMFMHPSAIGPYASADRVVSGGMLPLGLILLLAVEVHAGIGLYRLILKWGWFGWVDTPLRRRRLRRAIWLLILFMLTLGLLTQAAYVRIGIEHRDRAGERYVPAGQAVEALH
jgi:fumarate reductase subunit C